MPRKKELLPPGTKIRETKAIVSMLKADGKTVEDLTSSKVKKDQSFLCVAYQNIADMGTYIGAMSDDGAFKSSRACASARARVCIVLASASASLYVYVRQTYAACG